MNKLTSPDNALKYMKETGVDFIVANLGTEHRASVANLEYHSDIAREISALIGTRLVLHGCSSVAREQVENLFSDGVCKVNIWTCLERESSTVLFEEMLKNAAKIAGSEKAEKLFNSELLGKKANIQSQANLNYFTNNYRQSIVFVQMKKIVSTYLNMWYIR